MAHPALLTLAYVNFPRAKILRATLVIWMCAHALVLGELAHHWIPVDPTQLKTYEFTHYDGFLAYANKPAPLYLGSYQAAAAVSYKLRRQVYKLNGLNRRDFYDFVPDSVANSDSFLLGCETYQTLPEWALKAGYREVSSQPVSSEFRIIEVKRIAQSSGR
jgi:hypothetical protein